MSGAQKSKKKSSIKTLDYGTVGAFYCFKPKDTVFATVLSNRGCRAQCTFCSVANFNGRAVRSHRPKESIRSAVTKIPGRIVAKDQA